MSPPALDGRVNQKVVEMLDIKNLSRRTYNSDELAISSITRALSYICGVDEQFAPSAALAVSNKFKTEDTISNYLAKCADDRSLIKPLNRDLRVSISPTNGKNVWYISCKKINFEIDLNEPPIDIYGDYIIR